MPIESSEPQSDSARPRARRRFGRGAPRLTAHKSLRHTVVSRLRGYATPTWLVKHGLKLGRDVYLGAVHFDYGFLGLITIGDEAVVTDGVRIVAHDASIKHWLGYSRVGRVDIGRRVYVGVGAILLPGVTDRRRRDRRRRQRGHARRRAQDGGRRQPGGADRHARGVRRPPARRVSTDGLATRATGFVGPESVPRENIERMRRELADGDGLVE